MNPTDSNGKLIYSDVDYVDTWRAMEDCVRKGLVHSIGVSNFNSQQLQRILDVCQIKPVTNQVPTVYIDFVQNNRLIIICTFIRLSATRI